MYQNNLTVGIFKSLQEAMSAIEELKKSNFDMNKVSIAGGLLISWILNKITLDTTYEQLGLNEIYIERYEKAMRLKNIILMVYSSQNEIEKVSKALLRNNAEFVANHHPFLHSKITNVA